MINAHTPHECAAMHTAIAPDLCAAVLQRCSKAAFADIKHSSASGIQGTRLPQTSMAMPSGVAGSGALTILGISGRHFIFERDRVVSESGRAGNHRLAAAATWHCSAAVAARDGCGRGVLGSSATRSVSGRAAPRPVRHRGTWRGSWSLPSLRVPVKLLNMLFCIPSNARVCIFGLLIRGGSSLCRCTCPRCRDLQT